MTEDWLQTALDEASDLYGFLVDKLVKLGGGFENKMFGFDTPELRLAVRVTPPGHKTPAEVEAEMDWLLYLAENDAPVVRVTPSRNDNLVEVVDTDAGPISVVCFDWAEGHIVTREDFSPDLFQTWGEAVGMLHRLTKAYRPPSKTPGRIQWFDDEYLDRALIPSDQDQVLQRFDSLMDYFKGRPTTRDTFGLIHQDVHQDNLFLDGKRLTVLDFDDSVYGFFIFDIANALGFSIWEKPKDMSNRQFADLYLKHFMLGYEKENRLDETWVEDLPKALKLFEFIHYDAFNMDHDLAGEGSFDALDERTKQILNRYRKSIEEDLPYIENTFCPYQ
ncbi:MAG: phosphotransferase enzyme family protein [Candidatus Thorarchaeota archaeon]